MINKLKSKIFLIIMVSLSIFVVSMITLFGVLNYMNTLRAATTMMDRVSNFEFNRRPFNENLGINIQEKEKIEGVYFVEVKNSQVIKNDDNNEEVENYALKLAQENSESGVIGKYLYKVIKTPQNTINIIFMENEKTIFNLRMIFVYSGIAICASIIIIYWISRKISETIVKPVAETFEKQKQFISDASHELKTPLAVIEANADVLENEFKDNKWLRIYTK